MTQGACTAELIQEANKMYALILNTTLVIEGPFM